MDNKDNYSKGFLKTKESFIGKFKNFFSNKIIDEEVYDELLDALILSDISLEASEEIIEKARKKAKASDINDASKLYDLVTDEIKIRLAKNEWDGKIKKPAILLFIGVNGAGKTTTIAKLANKFKNEGLKVLLAAGDTFRAGASQQLEVWAEKIDADLVRPDTKDPASVIYEAIDIAKTTNVDILLADTAGRLGTKQNLMDELSKIHKVCQKFDGFNLYTLLVLDANAGQNSILQTKSFNENAKIDGIIMTKLDGSSKGGVLITLAGSEFPPIWYIGLGEKLEDIEVFDKENFAKAIFN